MRVSVVRSLNRVAIHLRLTLLLLIDLLQERFVEQELLLVHVGPFALMSRLSLSLQKICVLHVDLPNLLVESSLLFFVVFLVNTPHVCLLVIKGFLKVLSIVFVLHLFVQKARHLSFVGSVFLHSSFIVHSLSKFFLHLVFTDHLVL